MNPNVNFTIYTLYTHSFRRCNLRSPAVEDTISKLIDEYSQKDMLKDMVVLKALVLVNLGNKGIKIVTSVPVITAKHAEFSREQWNSTHHGPGITAEAKFSCWRFPGVSKGFFLEGKGALQSIIDNQRPSTQTNYVRIVASLEPASSALLECLIRVDAIQLSQIKRL